MLVKGLDTNRAYGTGYETEIPNLWKGDIEFFGKTLMDPRRNPIFVLSKSLIFKLCGLVLIVLISTTDDGSSLQLYTS